MVFPFFSLSRSPRGLDNLPVVGCLPLLTEGQVQVLRCACALWPVRAGRQGVPGVCSVGAQSSGGSIFSPGDGFAKPSWPVDHDQSLHVLSFALLLFLTSPRAKKKRRGAGHSYASLCVPSITPSWHDVETSSRRCAWTPGPAPLGAHCDGSTSSDTIVHEVRWQRNLLCGVIAGPALHRTLPDLPNFFRTPAWPSARRGSLSP